MAAASVDGKTNEDIMSNNITVIAITLISLAALLMLGVESKDIAIAAIGGLVGFLAKKNVD